MALTERTTLLITEERVREIALQVTEEAIETLRQELGQPGPEWEEARQVWIALSALADAQRRTEEALRDLTEAQRRTEERVEQLAEAQRRTEERVSRLEEVVQQLAEAQRRTEERLQRLEETVQALAEFVRQLAQRSEEQFAQLRSEIGRLANLVGLDLEADAEDVFWALAEKKGLRVLARPTPIVMDGEVDLAIPVEMPEGQRAWVLIEAKGRLRKAELEDWFKCLKNPSFQEKLGLHGVDKPYLPYMFGVRVYMGVEDLAQRTGIGILTFRGEMVPPRLWE
jgi:seryl-tRNA synthetase